uniref:Uncharacterized protein n=1 Tax=Anguilla anguilla TaxID=7936 RepID=A0A0E9XES2_ANGAN
MHLPPHIVIYIQVTKPQIHSVQHTTLARNVYNTFKQILVFLLLTLTTELKTKCYGNPLKNKNNKKN